MSKKMIFTVGVLLLLIYYFFIFSPQTSLRCQEIVNQKRETYSIGSISDYDYCMDNTDPIRNLLRYIRRII